LLLYETEEDVPLLLNGRVIIGNVKAAESFFSRAKGLIGSKKPDEDFCLFIPRCGAVHTFFMSFPIDVAGVDRDNRVTGLKKNMKPFRFFAAGGASAIYEFAEGTAERNGIKKGDVLILNEEKR
jgi:uncharacterized protein